MHAHVAICSSEVVSAALKIMACQQSLTLITGLVPAKKLHRFVTMTINT